MQKLTIFFGTIFIAILLTSVYVMVQNFIAFSISPDYFTQIKFPSFSYNSIMPGSEREKAVMLGLSSAWWIGIIIGAAVGFIALLYNDPGYMRSAVRNGFLVIFCTVTIINFILLTIGKFYWSRTDAALTPLVPDKDNFVAVKSVDDFIMYAVIAGIVFALVYMIANKARLIRLNSSTV